MHFEDIWNKSEEVAIQTNEGLLHYLKNVENIKNLCDYILINKKIESHDIGEILFQLCAISAKTGINVASALQHTAKENELDNYDE
jgi:hypothetical protein